VNNLFDLERSNYKFMIKNYSLFMLFFLFIGCVPVQKLDNLIGDLIMKGRAVNDKYNEKLIESNGCPPGAYRESCGSGCGPPTCASYFQKSPGVCPAVCTHGCACINGKILDETINQCVEIEDCYNYIRKDTNE